MLSRTRELSPNAALALHRSHAVHVARMRGARTGCADGIRATRGRARRDRTERSGRLERRGFEPQRSCRVCNAGDCLSWTRGLLVLAHRSRTATRNRGHRPRSGALFAQLRPALVISPGVSTSVDHLGRSSTLPRRQPDSSRSAWGDRLRGSMETREPSSPRMKPLSRCARRPSASILRSRYPDCTR